MEQHATDLTKVPVFEVNKTDFGHTRIHYEDASQPLMENEVLLRVDKFALTANNISYAIAGDSLGYWRFFPTQDNQSWGRLPVMGYAVVEKSNCADIGVGERVWGFVPMSTHIKIVAGNISTSGFSDVRTNRQGLSPVYAAFERVTANPFYKKDNEDYNMLVRGLFTTSWLIDDFMFDNDYFGADQYLITSASSKTSIALAFAIKQRKQRTAIGLTSKSNLAFVKKLGCYDQVITYDQIELLDNNHASILVDMAGSKTTLAAVHIHFLNSLKYSCRVGVTHNQDLVPDELNSKSELLGPTPTFFFAPSQLKKRTQEWGGTEAMKQIGIALAQYIEFCKSSISINHTKSTQELEIIYKHVLEGSGDASVGQVVSIS